MSDPQLELFPDPQLELFPDLPRAEAWAFPDSCDGCGQDWDTVRPGPMLEERVWVRIVDRSQDVLCDRCIGRLIKQALGRPLSFDDLKVCPFNEEFLLPSESASAGPNSTS